MDKDSGTPRVFLIRHGKAQNPSIISSGPVQGTFCQQILTLSSGQTEWSINGRHTGSTDIPLTKVGEAQVTRSSHVIIGPGKVIDPKNLTKVYISPRTRARHTYELLFNERQREEMKERVEITEDIREWEYGRYEGLLTSEIQKIRRNNGLDKDSKWDIWRDGCEEGESPAEIAERLDALIAEIRKIQSPYMYGEKPTDIVIIAHGHRFVSQFYPSHKRLY